VNSSPMASDVGVFSGEVEGIVDGSGEFEHSVQAADGNVAVSAEAEWISLPVVGGAADELSAEEFDW